MKSVCAGAIRGPKLKIIGRTLASERGVSLIVVIMLMVIILAITAAGLFFSSIDLRVSGNFRAGTQAFYAADTGVNVGYARIGLDPAVSTAPISGTVMIGGLPYPYRSGHISDSTAQPLQLRSIKNEPGYSLGSGTGYNTSGYSFYQYQINVTGTGPLASAREVEAQAEYGPVPR